MKKIKHVLDMLLKLKPELEKKENYTMVEEELLIV